MQRRAWDNLGGFLLRSVMKGLTDETAAVHTKAVYDPQVGGSRLPQPRCLGKLFLITHTPLPLLLLPLRIIAQRWSLFSKKVSWTP